MTEDPDARVSIIIPARNEEKNIARAVREAILDDVALARRALEARAPGRDELQFRRMRR